MLHTNGSRLSVVCFGPWRDEWACRAGEVLASEILRDRREHRAERTTPVGSLKAFEIRRVLILI